MTMLTDFIHAVAPTLDAEQVKGLADLVVFFVLTPLAGFAIAGGARFLRGE